jgi:hypothetical protein
MTFDTLVLYFKEYGPWLAILIYYLFRLDRQMIRLLELLSDIRGLDREVIRLITDIRERGVAMEKYKEEIMRLKIKEAQLSPQQKESGWWSGT